MTLEHLNTIKNQAQAISGLDHLNDPKTGLLTDLQRLIAQGDLTGQLHAFLLSCKVDGLSPRSIQDYEQKIGVFVSHCQKLQASQPQDITVQHVRLFLLSLQQRCNPNSIHDYYGVVKRFFNWLVSEGIIEKNPMSSMRPPRVPRKIIQPFSPEQVKNLLSLLNENTFLGARNQAIIFTFLDTGLRLSEMASIQLKDVDFDREWIKVMGKGSKERFVGIAKNTQKALLRYLLMRHDPHPCLWVTEERWPMHALGIQIMIRRLGKRAAISNVRCSPHTFRHTFGTWSMLYGASEREVQLLLGHATDRMTKQYTATITSQHAVKGHRIWSPVDKMHLK